MFVSLSLSPGTRKRSNPGNEISNYFVESGKLHFCFSDQIPKLRLGKPWTKNDNSSMFKGLPISRIKRVFTCTFPGKLKDMDLKKKHSTLQDYHVDHWDAMNNWQRYSNCGRMKS